EVGLHARRQPNREPRLARAARTDQGQQACGRKERAGFVELVLPTDKTGPLGWQATPRFEGPDGRKVCGESGNGELREVLGLVEVLQAMRAEIAQHDTRGQPRLDERARGR